MFETKVKTQGASEWLKQVLPDFKERKEHFTKKERRQLRKRLLELSDQEIIDVIGMAEMPLIAYILKIKYEKEIQLVPIEGDVMLSIGECNFANLTYLPVILHFMTLENGKLTLEGNISFPAALSGKYSFYISVNDERIDPQFEDANLDLKICGQTYEKRTVFKAEIPLEDITEIRFINETGELDCECGKINSERFFPVADVIPEQYYTQDGWLLYIEGSKLVCKKVTPEDIQKKEELFQKSLNGLFPKKADWANGLREHYFEKMKTKQKPVWLFMDRPDRADDNAFVLFEYMQQFEEIDSFFVISGESSDYKKVCNTGMTVKLFSEEHYRLSLLADAVISSQCNGTVENPFWNDAELFRDIYHRPKRIFLQHGVMQNDMSALFNRFHTGLHGFVTSTKDEYRSILEYPYHYSEKEVWLTGLTRFDKLYDDNEKYILIAPSWRNWLAEQIWDPETGQPEWTIKDGFENSEYCIKYKKLINDKKLLTKTKKNGYKLAFKMHPILAGGAADFVENGLIELWDEKISYRDALAKSSLLITDYSSIAFDFAYLNKPVVYYQFDKKAFFEKHYPSGYFDYEKDGPGPVFAKQRQLVDFIIDYIEGRADAGQFSRPDFIEVEDHCKLVFEKIKDTVGGDL